MAASQDTAPSDFRFGGLFLVCLAGVIWGTIGPSVRLINGWSGLSAWVISAYRAVAAVGALLLIAVLRARAASSWVPVRRHWQRVTVVGLLTAAFQLLFFIAVVAAGVSVATVVCLGFAPVLVLSLEAVRARRLPSAGRCAIVAIALIGLLLVCFGGGNGYQAPHLVAGIIAALGAGSAWGVSAAVAKPLSQRIDSHAVTAATMAVAAVVLVPGGLLVGYLRGESLTTADPKSWLAMVYLGVVTMAVAYTIFYAGLRTTSAGSAVVATLIEPVAAVVLAFLLLHERLSVAGLAGCLLILAAIAGLGRQPRSSLPGQIVQ